MAVKVAINGFGRIGRLVLRAMVESGRDDLVPVAINDLGSTEANAHLFHYDSVHGRFPGQLEVSGDTITIRYGGRVWGPIKVSAERDPTKVPYAGVDVALECTGIFTSKDKASALIKAGARKVLAAGATMERIAEAIQLVSTTVDGLLATMDEQAGGVARINDAVTAMDSSTQQNAALVEQAAAATDSLNLQAKSLADAIGQLRT